ncbi:MAG: hypothetical protein QOE56_2647 [Solirubrobacterales bacterium]|nr:hypothetical protein [Solirubrobacterales bacterium]
MSLVRIQPGALPRLRLSKQQVLKLESVDVQVDYSPYARAQLKSLGKAAGAIVHLELKTLFDTRKSHEGFRALYVRHDPPWWWVKLNSAYAAVVRARSDDELAAKGAAGPRIFCGLLVNSEEELRRVEKRLIEEAEEADDDEEEE